MGFWAASIRVAARTALDTEGFSTEGASRSSSVTRWSVALSWSVVPWHDQHCSCKIVKTWHIASGGNEAPPLDDDALVESVEPEEVDEAAVDDEEVVSPPVSVQAGTI